MQCTGVLNGLSPVNTAQGLLATLCDLAAWVREKRVLRFNDLTPMLTLCLYTVADQCTEDQLHAMLEDKEGLVAWLTMDAAGAHAEVNIGLCRLLVHTSGTAICDLGSKTHCRQTVSHGALTHTA